MVRSARIDWPRRGAAAPARRARRTHWMRRCYATCWPRRVSSASAARWRSRPRRAASASCASRRQWRVTARVSDATMPLGDGLPAVEKLAGTIRYSAGQLRGLALAGNWLGGPVEIESRRAAAGGAISFAVNGVADAAPLLRLLGQEEVAQRVSGQFAWTGSAQANPATGCGRSRWRAISLASRAACRAPFDKPRARAVPVDAALVVARDGVREFTVERPRARCPWPGACRRHQRAFRSAGRLG